MQRNRGIPITAVGGISQCVSFHLVLLLLEDLSGAV